MKCKNCRTHVDADTYIIVIDTDNLAMRFCDLDCLYEWLKESGLVNKL